VPPVQGTQLDCHINVNARTDQNFRDDIKRAAFLLSIPQPSGYIDGCSGTLINRNTGQSSLGQYFITAWHCFKTGQNCGGDENVNQEMTFTFNFQSPDANSEVFQQNQLGNVYTIRRHIRLVDHFVCAYGDFAICEILGAPIPPYFNVYYAGWNPNDLLINTQAPFALIHHPLSSIKKISGANEISGTHPGKMVCRVITKLLDFLFGWLWHRRWSTQVICTYIQAPFIGTQYHVSHYEFGKDEHGSSGGGLFNSNNRLVGTLSGNIINHSCNFIDFGISSFGKFADSYYRQATKNTLNPTNKYGIDQTGIPGRQITCYPQITLAAETAGGIIDLYPANLYQQDNQITLTSRTTVTTNDFVTVHTGADFTLEAGTSITLNAGFRVDPGATFTTRITPAQCVLNESTYRTTGDAADVSEYDTPDMNKMLSSMPYPQEKSFDINKYLPTTEKGISSEPSVLNIFPNPASSIINVQSFFTGKQKKAILSIYDLYGRTLWSKQYSDVYYIKEAISVLRFANSMYNVSISTENFHQSKRFVIAK
jgi:hypothetical protein